MTRMSLFVKEKQTHRHRKQTYGYQREKDGRDQFELNRCTLLYTK